MTKKILEQRETSVVVKWLTEAVEVMMYRPPPAIMAHLHAKKTMDTNKT